MRYPIRFVVAMIVPVLAACPLAAQAPGRPALPFDPPAPGSERPAAPAPAMLRIFDAEYGDQASQRLCDATKLVAALCDGHNACTIPVGNSLCGDPAFGTRKKLHMAFKCEGGAPLLIVAPEPNSVRIACPLSAKARDRRT